MQIWAYILLTMTTAIWASNTIIGKLIAGHASPMLITSLRWVVALAALITFAWPYLKRDWPIIKQSLPYLLLCSVFGFAGFNIAHYLGLNYTTAVNSSIIQAAIPAVIFLLNYALVRIKVSPFQIIGFILTLIGIMFTASAGNLANLTGLELNIGDVFTFIAVGCYATYTVALKWRPKMHWISFMTMIAMITILTSSPFTIWELSQERTIWPDAKAWALIIFVGIFPSVVSQVFYIKANEIIGANRAGIFINLIPIFGVFLSVILLGETLHDYNLISLILIICGIALSEYSSFQKPQKKSAPSK